MEFEAFWGCCRCDAMGQDQMELSLTHPNPFSTPCFHHFLCLLTFAALSLLLDHQAPKK